MEISIASLERSCIACLSSWNGKTVEGGDVNIRLRSGVLNIELDGDTIYRESIGDSFVRYMNAREVREKLRVLECQIKDDIVPSFHDIPSEEFNLELLSDWIDEIRCGSCEWNVEGSDIENVEYETVVPQYCPECKSDIHIESSKPDRLSDLTEK